MHHTWNRKYLIIDCAELNGASTDAALINGLARQTGYRPVFSFLNSLYNTIDLASVGLIGQKSALYCLGFRVLLFDLA